MIVKLEKLPIIDFISIPKPYICYNRPIKDKNQQNAPTNRKIIQYYGTDLSDFILLFIYYTDKDGYHHYA